MKPEFENIPLVRNAEKSRFEISVDDHIGFINYGEMGDQVALVHTEVDPVLSGRGVASALVEKTLLLIEENNKKILPYCPYVLAYIKKHPQWKRIVDKGFGGYDHL